MASATSKPILISRPATPNSMACADDSVEALLPSLEELHLTEKGQDNHIQFGTCLSRNSGVELDNVPPLSAVSAHGSGPLNSQNIWAYDYQGDSLPSEVDSGMGNLLGSFNYGNIFNLDHERNKYADNLPNFPSQFDINNFLNNPVSMLQGKSDSLLDSNLSLYHKNGSENSGAYPVYEATGRESLSLPNENYGCCVLPTSGYSTGHYDLTFFNSLSSEDIALLAMSEYGLQYFQDMLDSGVPMIRNKIAIAVVKHLFVLMSDQYGTRLFHKLIKLQRIDELELIFSKMIFSHESLIRVSQTKYGSLSVQKLIKDFKKSPLIREVASALAKGVYTLMTHQTGRYVIYQCFNLLDNHKKEPLSEALIHHCIQLAMHAVGCTCLKKCIDLISGLHRDLLLNKIAENSVCFALDPSGNYVLQHVLDLQNPIITDRICSRLHGSCILLSYLKSGSHVVETCLKSSGMKYVIQELLASHDLVQLARDKFGNYVIQTALRMTKRADTKSHQCLLRALKPHMQSLQLHPTGKNVYNLIQSGVPFEKLSEIGGKDHE